MDWLNHLFIKLKYSVKWAGSEPGSGVGITLIRIRKTRHCYRISSVRFWSMIRNVANGQVHHMKFKSGLLDIRNKILADISLERDHHLVACVRIYPPDGKPKPLSLTPSVFVIRLLFGNWREYGSESKERKEDDATTILGKCCVVRPLRKGNSLLRWWRDRCCRK